MLKRGVRGWRACREGPDGKRVSSPPFAILGSGNLVQEAKGAGGDGEAAKVMETKVLLPRRARHQQQKRLPLVIFNLTYLWRARLLKKL